MISVIIPTYNRTILLKQTLLSILDQTYKNIEILVIDDGSTQNNEQLIDYFSDDRISYYKIDHAGLPAVTRNFGIKKSRGQYIAFCDDDDVWLKNKLEKQINILQNEPKLIGVCSNAYAEPVGFRLFNFKNNVCLDFKRVANFSCIINSTVLLKKDIFKKLGFLDESKDLRATEDYDYWLRILDYKDRSIKFIYEPLIKYRIDNIGLVKGKDVNKKMGERVKKVLFKYKDKYPEFINNTILNVNYRIKKADLLNYIINCKTSISFLITNNLLSTKDKVFFVMFYILFYVYKRYSMFLKLKNFVLEDKIIDLLKIIRIDIKKYHYKLKQYVRNNRLV